MKCVTLLLTWLKANSFGYYIFDESSQHAVRLGCTKDLFTWHFF